MIERKTLPSTKILKNPETPGLFGAFVAKHRQGWKVCPATSIDKSTKNFG